MGKGAFTAVLKRPGIEANQLPSPWAEFKNAGTRNYTPPYNFMACKETRLTFLRSRFQAFPSPMLLAGI
jgi:hypothetical protein